MIESIELEVISNGRRGGRTWFHPKASMVPQASQGAGRLAVMTLQEISGSDVFGHVHETESGDLGRSWTPPQPIPGMGRKAVGGGLFRGICDVVPDHHPRTSTVLAIGHDVYYKEGRLAIPEDLFLGPVYSAKDLGTGRWSEPRRLALDDDRMAGICSPGCAQRHTFEDGTMLLPCSWARRRTLPRAVGTLRTAFDGKEMKVEDATPHELRHDVGRGLLEPSLTEFSGRFYLTIRAEDGKGYLSTSDDGLNWCNVRPWAWEDGEPLTMSTTQQHWLRHSKGLHLVYTRQSASNINVFRWRAPLYVASVDPDELCLVRETERVVFPLIGDGIGDPQGVARMGNFHTVSATPRESWVTVGETLPFNAWRGDTLLARVHWSQANRNAPEGG
jgi:hypothetical protein